MAAAESKIRSFLGGVDAAQGSAVEMPVVQNTTDARLQEQYFRCSVPYPYKPVKYHSLAASDLECECNGNQPNIGVLSSKQNLGQGQLNSPENTASDSSAAIKRDCLLCRKKFKTDIESLQKGGEFLAFQLRELSEKLLSLQAELDYVQMKKTFHLEVASIMKEQLHELRSEQKNNAVETQVLKNRVRDLQQCNLEFEEKIKFGAQTYDTKIDGNST